MVSSTTSRTLLLSSFAALASAAWPQGVDVPTFIAKERGIALQGMLANIGPNGTQVPGASAGIVVASPSTDNPDYFYTWSRDSALTMKTIVDELLSGTEGLEPYLEDYITAQAVIQTVKNPSGSLLPSGLGLGEPKYNVDGTRFNGNWGRPQRDGPALRSIAIITYANHLIGRGETERVRDVIWPVIANDLSYTGQYWNTTGFDLWEEVSGSSFFTTLGQYRALVEGGRLASALGVACTGCDQAANVLCFLQSAYWNGEHLVGNINTATARSGVDANTMLASLAAFDVAAPCAGPTFQPCHPRSLASFKVFVDTFRNATLYPLNAGLPTTAAVALGRYPEDIYYDGNPWYLITLGAAEFLYGAVAQWSRDRAVTVDAASLPFFRDLYPAAAVGVYRRQACGGKTGSNPFAAILSAARAYADGFVAVAQSHTPADGALSEQFAKTDGTPTSARDLTWSYASFVSMAARRAGRSPPSWVDLAAEVPETCSAGATKGVYAPALAAGAPNVTAECTATVRFEVDASTYYGENVYLAGNTSDLGGWDLGEAVPLLSSNYTSERPLWYVDAPLAAGRPVSYVYVRQENCDQPWIWETVNRTLTVPACVEDDDSVRLTVEDTFTGAAGTAGSC